MTNEERDKVIRILQWLHDNKFLFRSTEEDVKYATKLAIQELSQETPVKPQEPRYCDRNICTKNEYNGIGCDECEVMKSQEPTDENLHREREQAYMQGYEDTSKRFRQEPSGDLISRQTVIDITWEEPSYTDALNVLTEVRDKVKALPPVNLQEPKTDKYEYHIDHTDCIWYGSDGGCPVTCSQYRDGWNDAMDYIFKNGKGYQPYRHDG